MWWSSAHDQFRKLTLLTEKTPISDTCGALKKYWLNRHNALQPLRVPVTPERGAKEQTYVFVQINPDES
jgi:hypothetical protein